MCASLPCSFHSLISIQTFRGSADSVGGQLRGDEESPKQMKVGVCLTETRSLKLRSHVFSVTMLSKKGAKVISLQPTPFLHINISYSLLSFCAYKTVTLDIRLWKQSHKPAVKLNSRKQGPTSKQASSRQWNIAAHDLPPLHPRPNLPSSTVRITKGGLQVHNTASQHPYLSVDAVMVKNGYCECRRMTDLVLSQCRLLYCNTISCEDENAQLH